MGGCGVWGVRCVGGAVCGGGGVCGTANSTTGYNWGTTGVQLGHTGGTPGAQRGSPPSAAGGRCRGRGRACRVPRVVIRGAEGRGRTGFLRVRPQQAPHRRLPPARRGCSKRWGGAGGRVGVVLAQQRDHALQIGAEAEGRRRRGVGEGLDLDGRGIREQAAGRGRVGAAAPGLEGGERHARAAGGVAIHGRGVGRWCGGGGGGESGVKESERE